MLQALKSQRGRGWTFLLVGPLPRVWLEGEMSTLKCRRDRGEGISMGLWFSRGVKLQPWGAATAAASVVVGRGKWERGGKSERERVKERGGEDWSPLKWGTCTFEACKNRYVSQGLAALENSKSSQSALMPIICSCMYSGMGTVMVIHSHRREHVLKGAGWKDG